MSALADTHPVQALFGSLLIAEDLATSGRQLTFAVISRDCAAWAEELAGVLCDIHRRAGDLTLAVREYAADRVFTVAEERHLSREIGMIAQQAWEGRVL